MLHIFSIQRYSAKKSVNQLIKNKRPRIQKQKKDIKGMTVAHRCQSPYSLLIKEHPNTGKYPYIFTLTSYHPTCLFHNYIYIYIHILGTSTNIKLLQFFNDNMFDIDLFSINFCEIFLIFLPKNVGLTNQYSLPVNFRTIFYNFFQSELL